MVMARLKLSTKNVISKTERVIIGARQVGSWIGSIVGGRIVGLFSS